MIQSIPAPLRMVALLTASNVFMTFAWYGHLKHLQQRVWLVAALASWGIALFEYRSWCRPTASALPAAERRS
jgi:uncharacterized protein (DUF486 family)